MPYKPVFPGPCEGWATNYNRAHYWKVQKTIPMDDLMQEASVVFLRCRRKYPETDTPQHFMALFKTAWVRAFVDLARESSEERIFVSNTRPDNTTLDQVGEVENDGYLAVLLSEAPREVSMVLSLFLNAPAELVEIAFSGWNGKDRRFKHGGGSKRICKMLGLPEDLDVMQLVEDHFR